MSNETKRDVFDELLEIAGNAMDQAMSAQYPSDENGCAPDGIGKAICDILDPIEKRYDAASPCKFPVIPEAVGEILRSAYGQTNLLGVLETAKNGHKMSDKIIRLESISLMDHDDDRNDGGTFQTTRMIKVGHPYDEPHFKPDYDGSYEKLVECHSDRDVVSIDLIRDSYYSDGGCYCVRLKDSNKLYLPINAFIAETKEIIDN